MSVAQVSPNNERHTTCQPGLTRARCMCRPLSKLVHPLLEHSLAALLRHLDDSFPRAAACRAQHQAGSSSEPSNTLQPGQHPMLVDSDDEEAAGMSLTCRLKMQSSHRLNAMISPVCRWRVSHDRWSDRQEVKPLPADFKLNILHMIRLCS